MILDFVAPLLGSLFAVAIVLGVAALAAACDRDPED